MQRPTALVFPDNLAALATCRELGRSGVPVVVLSARPGPASRSRFARYIPCPDLYEEGQAWAEAIAALAASLPEPPVLFPTEDAALLLAEAHRPLLSTKARFCAAGPAVVDGVLDKARLYRAAQAVGLAVPAFRELAVGQAAGNLSQLEGSWIVKPPCRYVIRDGRVRTFLSLTGGSKALAENLTAAAARVGQAGFPVLLQEQIPGPFENLVSVGMVLGPDGELRAAFTARKRWEYPEPFGDGLMVEVIDDPGITEPAVRLLRSLGYWGICDVEFKLDPRDGRHKLLDANPRVWLWLGLGARAGQAIALSGYDLAVGGNSRLGRPGHRSVYPRWVSPRGAAAFLANTYEPGRHGASLPVRLTLGALRTMLGNLFAFRDPLYLRPSAWKEIAGVLARRTRIAATAPAGSRLVD